MPMTPGPHWNDSRTARWRVRLLTQKEATVRSDLDGVAGGVIDWSVHDEIRSAGNLDLVVTSYTKSIDWAKYRIGVDYILRYGGKEIVTPCGIYIPSAPKRDMSSTGTTIDLEFFDKTIILRQDALRSTKSFAKNTRITDAVRWCITSTGETNVAITPSTKKFSSNRVYRAGTSKLEILRKLLEDLNYFAVWTDGKGQFQCHPQKAPRSRGITYEFKEGATSIHSAKWELDQDGFEVPNRVVGIGRQSGKGKAKVAFVEDWDSRWGFRARGRWITRVERDLEEKTQAKLLAKVKALLRESQDVHDKITIQHGFLPVAMNDIAKFSSQGYSGLFAWRTMRANLTPTGLAESTLEGVAA